MKNKQHYFAQVDLIYQYVPNHTIFLQIAAANKDQAKLKARDFILRSSRKIEQFHVEFPHLYKEPLTVK